MHRHAVGDGRPPARIGAGVEIAFEDHAGDVPSASAPMVAFICGGMALGGRHHRFVAGVGKRRRPAGLQRHEADERLQRNIELGAEAAAGGGRHDAHLFRRQGRAPSPCRRGPYRAPACRRRRPACRRPYRHSRLPARYRRARHRRSRWRRTTVTAAPASAASGSPRSTKPLVSRLPGRFAWISAAPSACASHGLQQMRQLGPARSGNPTGRDRASPRARRRSAPPPRRETAQRPRPAPAGRRRARMTPKQFSPGMSAAVKIADDAGMFLRA